MIGDIIFARFPFADKPRFKERPLLVVSHADDNGDLHVLKITSKGLDQSQNIPLTSDDFEFGELSRASAIVPNSTACIHKSAVTRFVGRLKPAKIQAILKQRICSSTRDFSTIAHAANRPGNDPAHPHNQSTVDSGQSNPPPATRHPIPLAT